MTNITVIIYSYNAQNEIQNCITSAKLLSEKIILIDLESHDKTVEIAKKNGVTIYIHPFSTYVEPVRNFGIQKAETGWIFILDTDERVTNELAAEIKKAIRSDEYSYYKVPRKDFFGEKVWLEHGGWWPNHQIRLINTEYFKDWPSAIHSTPVIDGKLGFLKNPLLHYSKNDYSQIVEKTIKFEDAEAELLYKAGRPVTTLTFFRKFLAELYRRLFKAQGYKDGTIGIIESIYQAYSKTITYIYLYEKKNRSSV